MALAPGEKATVTFSLEKSRMGFFDNEGVYHLEDGVFQIFAGTSSEDCLCQEVNLTF